MSVRLRVATAADRTAVAALIHGTTNGWYTAQGRNPLFAGPPADCELFFEVHERLAPGCCLVAEDGGELVGPCFWHPRPTHVSLGIMNVAPEAYGRGIARRLLARICDEADRRGLPVRLVSSSQNLGSFSLYNGAGFAPIAGFQVVLVPVPEAGLPELPPESGRVRAAVAKDVPAMVELEREILGIDREQDFAQLVEGLGDVFSASVLPGDAGLEGFLFSSRTDNTSGARVCVLSLQLRRPRLMPLHALHRRSARTHMQQRPMRALGRWAGCVRQGLGGNAAGGDRMGLRLGAGLHILESPPSPSPHPHRESGREVPSPQRQHHTRAPPATNTV